MSRADLTAILPADKPDDKKMLTRDEEPEQYENHYTCS